MDFYDHDGRSFMFLWAVKVSQLKLLVYLGRKESNPYHEYMAEFGKSWPTFGMECNGMECRAMDWTGMELSLFLCTLAMVTLYPGDTHIGLLVYYFLFFTLFFVICFSFSFWLFPGYLIVCRHTFCPPVVPSCAARHSIASLFIRPSPVHQSIN